MPLPYGISLEEIDLKSSRENLSKVEAAIISQIAVLTKSEEQLNEIQANLSKNTIERKKQLKTDLIKHNSVVIYKKLSQHIKQALMMMMKKHV